MGSHFHLLIRLTKPTLSRGMGRLCSSYAQWFNWKYDRFGHLFAQRFSSRHIEEETHLFEVHRYIALNPVRAGLCANPTGWPWGSYRALAGFERPVDFLDVDAVYDLFSQRPDEARRAYRVLVRSGLEEQGSDPDRGQTPDIRLRV
jgi:REP-associated tyrosine transposase